jgi:surfeit locus 1 family protein
LTNYNFKPGWKVSVAFIAVLVLFIGLGCWQLQRAAEKKALMAARELRSQEPPLRLTGAEADPDGLRYHRVQVTGDYDSEHQFLVDNQVHDSQPGYHVLTPLRISGSNKAVLVNRGWVPLGARRTELPEISIRNVHVQVSGAIDHFHRTGLTLEGAEVPGPGWPSVVQWPVPERLAERLGYPLLPYQVLLDPSESGGYVRVWHEARLAPEKNQGYALQWFLFAAVAAILYVRYGLKAGSKAITP